MQVVGGRGPSTGDRPPPPAGKVCAFCHIGVTWVLMDSHTATLQDRMWSTGKFAQREAVPSLEVQSSPGVSCQLAGLFWIELRV